VNVSPWGCSRRAQVRQAPATKGQNRSLKCPRGIFIVWYPQRVKRDLVFVKIEMRVWDVHSSRQDGNLRSVLTDTTLTVTVRETDESYTQVLAPV
jgi:hypothetical protein